MNQETPQQPPGRRETLLEVDQEVELIWMDAHNDSHLTVGRFQGVAVPERGGPVRFVFKTGTDELRLDPDLVVGMTRTSG